MPQVSGKEPPPMSLEQQPQKHDSTPVESMPPYPHNPSDTVIPPVEHRDEKNGLDLKKKIGLVLAGLGIAGTAGFVGKFIGGNETAPSEQTPTVSATLDPVKNLSPTPETNIAPTVSENEISVADNPTFQLAVEAYYEKYVKYQESGTPADQTGDENRLVGILGADWESNPELAAYGNAIRDGSVTISTNHLATGENGDPEYEYNIEVVETSDVVEEDGLISGNVSIHATDNVMDTVLSTFASTGVNLDSYGNFHLTFTDVDGRWVLTEVDNLDNN